MGSEAEIYFTETKPKAKRKTWLLVHGFGVFLIVTGIIINIIGVLNISNCSVETTPVKAMLQNLSDTAQERDVLLQNISNSLQEKLQATTAHESQRWFLSNEKKTFAEATKACRDMGGQLIEITTMTKMRQVTAFIQSKHGIGSTREPSESVYIGAVRVSGKFQWQNDGSEVYDAFWAPGEPNNYKEKEDCAALLYMGNFMNDYSCENSYAFLCEVL